MIKRLSSSFFHYSIILFLSLILIFCARVLYSNVGEAPIYNDEPSWMQGAYFYHLLFIKKDILNKDWDSFISYDQPPVAKYIFGFLLNSYNHKDIDSNGGLMQWQLSTIIPEYNAPLIKFIHQQENPFDRKLLEYNNSLLLQIKLARVVPLDQQDYKLCRRAVFIIGLFATALLIIIGSYVFKNIIPGLMAGIFFLTNHTVIKVFLLALVDSMCCFFVLSSLLVLFWLFHGLKTKGSKRRVVAVSILEGLLLSLALGTKLITTYILVTVVLVFVASILFEIFKSVKAKNDIPVKIISVRVALLSLILTCAFSFFVLFNPFLYRDPIGGIIKMDHHRMMLMQMQSRTQSGGIKSFSQRISAVCKNGILMGNDNLNIFESFSYFFIFVVGLGVLIKKSYGELCTGFLGPPTILILLIATTFILNGAMIHIKWDRYFIPFMMCVSLIIGSGTSEMLDLLVVRLIKFKDYLFKRPQDQNPS